MIFNFIVLVPMLAAAFYMSTKGMFSALIMCFCTVISAVVAFGAYESVYARLLASHLPDLGPGVALLSLCSITLLLLRILADRFLRLNVLFPDILEKIGAGVFSVAAAFIMFGVIAVGWQMLPFDYPILGFQRYEGDIQGLKPGTEEKGLWLRCDRITVGMINFLSAGSLSGKTPFTAVHPDLLAEVDALSAALLRESYHYAPPAKTGEAFGPTLTLPDQPQYYTELTGDDGKPIIPMDEDHHFLVVPIQVPYEVRDADGKVRFTPLQVRLVAWPQRVRLKYKAQQFWPKYVMHPTRAPAMVPTARDLEIVQDAAQSGNNFCFAFEIPSILVPRFVEFKGTARAAVEIDESAQKPKGPPAKPTYTMVGAPPEKRRPGARRRYAARRPGLSGPVDVKAARFSDELPIKIGAGAVRAASTGVPTSAQALGACQVYGKLEDVARSGAPVTRLQVPSGYKLLQIRASKHEYRTTLLGNIARHVTSIAQAKVIAADGSTYIANGGYVIVNKADGQYIELIYSPDGMPHEYFQSPGVIYPLKIPQGEVRSNLVEAGYFFAIPHGKTIIDFVIGGGSLISGEQLNITAPTQ